MWSATVLSLFPEMFPGTLDFSIAGKALRNHLWSLKIKNNCFKEQLAIISELEPEPETI